MLNILVATSLLLLSPPAANAPHASAKALFERYVALGHAFDPGIADLYADTAVIRNRRTYATGQVRELTVPASKYRELIRTGMSLAKARDDRWTYSDIQYANEGNGVRVKATRYSLLKKYASPISLLLAPDEKGRWLVFEELSESLP